MEKVKLQDVASFSKGQQINGDELIENGQYEYLNGGINPSGHWKEFNVNGNTVTISEGGNSCGYINYMKFPFWCGAHCYYLYNLKIDSKYLYYALKSQQEKIMKLRSGACMPNIKKSDLGNFELIISTDVNIQNQTVLILENISELINKRKQQLEKLDELVKSRFVELFDNGKCTIKQVDELCSDIVDCPHTTPKYEGELKNPAIRTSEIKKGYITWDTMRYVSDDEYQERISRLKPLAGDIVYGREGTFGNAAILPKGFNFCLGQRVMLLRPNYQLCNSEYLLHALISDDVYQQAVGKNNASTVAHVNVKDVKQFKVPLPPIELQNQFAAFVKQVDKSKLEVQKSLEKLEVLKKALMQKYFG